MLPVQNTTNDVTSRCRITGFYSDEPCPGARFLNNFLKDALNSFICNVDDKEYRQIIISRIKYIYIRIFTCVRIIRKYNRI